MNTFMKKFIGTCLLMSMVFSVTYAEDNQTDFDAVHPKINALQAPDPTLPSGVAEPKGRV